MKATVIYFSLIFLAACTSPDKKAVEKEDSCNTIAVVHDMHELASCTFILETMDSKEKLEPSNLEEMKIQLRDGEKVRIGYAYEKDKLSACMAGKVVRLTCIEEVKE